MDILEQLLFLNPLFTKNKFVKPLSARGKKKNLREDDRNLTF